MSWLGHTWSAMWPNIFAPSAFTLAGVALSHIHLRRHVNRKHEELKSHIGGIRE